MQRTLTFSLALLLTLVVEQSGACINEYKALLSGKLVYDEAYTSSFQRRSLDTLELKQELAGLSKEYRRTKSPKVLSDYAAKLIYLGRLNEALVIYRDIEKQEPNLYATAANMGTAFELMGQLDSAYAYIQKALKLNPDSHQGSEWIHLKILEAKRQLQKDPDYLQKNNALGLYFGEGKKPVVPVGVDAEKLKDQLGYQLSERVLFVKPQDLLVGQLLFDLGNVTAVTSDVQTALNIYEEAREYGYSSDLMEERVSHLKWLQLKATVANTLIDNLLIVLILSGLLGIGLLWALYRLVKWLLSRYNHRLARQSLK